MSELKPCPFCGKVPTAVFSSDGFPQMCECMWATNSADKVLERWNTRPLEDAQAALITQLGKALKMIDSYELFLLDGNAILKDALSAYTTWKEKQK